VGGEAGEDILHPAQDRVGVLLHRVPRCHVGVVIGQRGLGRHEARLRAALFRIMAENDAPAEVVRRMEESLGVPA
jgi:hypothetical protein